MGKHRIRTAVLLCFCVVCVPATTAELSAQGVSEGVAGERDRSGRDTFIRIQSLCEEARGLAAINPDSAMDCAKRAMAMAEKQHDHRGMALASSITGWVHLESMEWDNAMHAYRRAMRYYREIGDSNRVAAVMASLGDAQRFSGALKDANNTYSTALSLLSLSSSESRDSTALSPLSTRAALLFGIAAVLHLEGRFDAALDQYRACDPAAERSGNAGILSSCLNNIGAIYHARGDNMTARSYYRMALQQAEITGNTRRLIRLRINLADAHMDSGDRITARELYQKCFALASRIRDVTSMSEAHAGFISTLTEKGTEQKADAGSPTPHQDHAVDLVFEHETSRQERELNLLKEKQKLQDITARRMQLEMQRTERQLQYVQAENETNQLKQGVTSAWLERERSKGKEREKMLELMESKKNLEAEAREREVLIRNFMIAGLVLVIIIALLFLRRFKDRRREMELKTQIAEARAAALESEKRTGEFEARKRFTQLLIDSQEQERKRIAADLHDGIGQDLLVIKNRLTLALREQTRGGDPSTELEEIAVAVSSSLQDIRRISRNLRPAQLDRIGLTSSIEAMIRTVRDSTNLELNASLENIDELFSKEREIDIYRIVQEGLNNIIKHSHATVAGITIHRHNGDIQILIHDNGAGFQIEEDGRRDGTAHEGFGLRGLYERTEILGGNINIDSAPKSGTRITVFLPVPQDRQPFSLFTSIRT